MKNNDLEKYISDLSPELQEKARQCKDMDELNKLLAENDVELSDDALEAVAGGAGCSDSNLSQGDSVNYFKCTECGGTLRYWDRLYGTGNRYYCDNGACVACQDHWLFAEVTTSDHEGNSYSAGVRRVK